MGVSAGRVPLSPDLCELSSWNYSAAKRALDVGCAGSLLFLSFPLLLLLGVLVKCTSAGPALFRQRRVGLHGREFELYKFRTMISSVNRSGVGVTCEDDSRITTLGRFMRKWKLDELPQLFNILVGDMSLVGPRPDLAQYMSCLGSQSAVLRLRPGLTGMASLKFRHEERLLAAIPSEQLEQFYIYELLPQKVQLDLEYARAASFGGDLLILGRTVLTIRH